MLAYLLWHRPRADVEREAYERAAEHFHRSLAHSPPAGFCGSALYRVGELPWLADAGTDRALYEDWYLVEDFTALGVLNEAAVAYGHRGAHEEIARRFGAGAGGLYGLVEGHARPRAALGAGGSSGSAGARGSAGAGGLPGACGSAGAGGSPGACGSPDAHGSAGARGSAGAAQLAIWIARPPGAERGALGELLGDGMDTERSSLWRRSLVLGPAPEYCLLGPRPPAGVAPARLPEGWRVTVSPRETLWSG